MSSPSSSEHPADSPISRDYGPEMLAFSKVQRRFGLGFALTSICILAIDLVARAGFW